MLCQTTISHSKLSFSRAPVRAPKHAPSGTFGNARIDRREPGYLPSLGEVRAAVERDLLAAQSEDTKNEFYEALRARYDVRIEVDPPVADARTAN